MFENFTHSSYAPATRLTNGELAQQTKLITENQLLSQMIDSISQMVVILNEHRQIVYSNKSFDAFCQSVETESLLGKRPGEAIACSKAFLSKSGCGTSECCKNCGAVNAILESNTGIRSTKECNILTKNNDAFELEITSTPLSMNEQRLTIFSMRDISAEKRRQSLERVFLHDILNSAGGISGLSSILKEIDDPQELKSLAETIAGAAHNLVEEIKAQRELNSAERGELKPELKLHLTMDILSDLKDNYSNHELNPGKEIIIHPQTDNVQFSTDKVLLKRILGNMVKNAIEVNLPNDRITLRCNVEPHFVLFSVHNNSVIPPEAQSELFKRNYSTKGLGRGLGTYSMKLLGEKYLKGKTWFESSEEDGTVFYIRLKREN